MGDGSIGGNTKFLASNADRDDLIGRPTHFTGEEIGLAQECGNKGGLGGFVELLGSTHLFNASLIHDCDGVRHCHGFFLVMGHVQEGQTDFLLDFFEL